MSERRAGLLVAPNPDGELAFLPATIALEIVPRRRISEVPGAEFGMVLIDGKVAAVIACGKGNTDLVLCEIDGQPVALSGLKVLDAGLFDSAPDNGVITPDGSPALEFDLPAAINQADTSPLALS